MEEFPFALVEAMSCGLVPVATDAGTIREHVQDGANGFLVPRERADLLADKIGVLLSDRSLSGRRRRSEPGEARQVRVFSGDGCIGRLGGASSVSGTPSSGERKGENGVRG